MIPFYTIFFSMLGGVLPALFWLWFWLKEDRLHPEPKMRIAAVFLAGMASVFLVLPTEKFLFGFAHGDVSLLIIFLWSSTEEIFKYAAAWWQGLSKKDADEPIDAVIYMITAALGFAALENALFLWNIIDVGLLPQSLITSNTRFLGATLLHVASSAIVGICLGLSYYKTAGIKKIFLFTGLSVAILLHALFNLFIIKFESNILFVFSGVWVLIIALIVLFEKIKRVRS